MGIGAMPLIHLIGVVKHIADAQNAVLTKSQKNNARDGEVGLGEHIDAKVPFFSSS